MDKTKILQSIRNARIRSTPLPKNIEPDLEGSVLLENFKKNIILVGGNCLEVSKNKLDAYLREHYPKAYDFRRSEIKQLYPADCPIEKLDKLKTVILEGQFGVAENGAIYIDEENFSNRLIPFINEDLIICLNSEHISANMHTAYNRIQNQLKSFGLFISGPSKTADIEQNLVFGAHGSKSCCVILYTHEDKDSVN